MSKTLEEIKSPIAIELEIFEKKFKNVMRSDVPLLQRITHYLTKQKGKQVRPILVFLCSKLVGKINDSTYHAAALVELLHTASLVHDDVVDDALERRGFFSIYALWKKKAAVLIGDYLLAKGLLLATEHKEFQLLEISSEAVKQIVEGELLQMDKSRKLNIEEEDYYKIINYKTASLIAAACAAGAAASTEDEAVINEMKEFGRLAGTAFQIQDDLLDYKKKGIGKPVGNDIKEKKITLPLIYTLRQLPAKEQREILHLIKQKSKKSKTVDQIVALVKKHGGLEYAKERMNEYLDKAKAILVKFPPSETNESLHKLLDFIVQRGH